MDIGEAGRGESLGEGLAIELRVVSRARDGADVHELLDVVLGEERQDFVQGARGVTDRPEVRPDRHAAEAGRYWVRTGTHGSAQAGTSG